MVAMDLHTAAYLTQVTGKMLDSQFRHSKLEMSFDLANRLYKEDVSFVNENILLFC